jgi:hypothetical protein
MGDKSSVSGGAKKPLYSPAIQPEALRAAPFWSRQRAPSTIGRERQGSLGVTEGILREKPNPLLLQTYTYHKSGNFATTVF